MKNKTRLRSALWHLLMAACVAVYAAGLVVVCEIAGRVDPATFLKFLRTDVSFTLLKNTAVLAGLLILTLYFLTRRIHIAMMLVSIPLLLCHVINAFKLQLRNEPFYPWDITLAGEATNILSTIELHPSGSMVLAVAFIAASVVIAFVLDRLVLRRHRPELRVSLAGFLAMTAAFGMLCGAWFSRAYIEQHTIPLRVYNQHWSYKENGFVYTFAANIYHARIDKPEHYGEAQMAELTAGCEGSEGSVEPNVIIIMSEAFADIWNAKNLEFAGPLAPNYTSLAEQYLSGNCMTSEYGGNTANSEFEVLTGYSTYLMPSGTVAYMSYVNQPTDSYVSFLNSRDYHTVALHPYLRSYFSREKAYELMGFDEFYSVEHFQGAERLRLCQWVSDDAVADRIILEYEQNLGTGKRFFCHTVTMLNHTSYYADDWTEDQRVGMTANCELSSEEFAAIQSYATGITRADAMIGRLVAYFEQVEEPTVIVFFGDHQPSLGTPGYELMQRIGYVDDNTSADGVLALQSTPYLIWNNFESQPTAQKMDLSMFHLLPYMTRMLDLPRPGFHSYMDTLFDQTRGVTRQVSLDGSGDPVLMLDGDSEDAFREYLAVVYDGLLGRQYGSRTLYNGT